MVLIKQPNWKYRDTVTKIIKVEDKDEDKREVDAIDLEMFMPFILDVPENISMEDIQVGENYRATFKVYTAELTPEIDKLWSKMEKKEHALREGIQHIKKFSGRQPLYKFELIKAEPV